MPARPRNPRHVPLSSLRIDGGTQARDVLDEDAIMEYTIAMTDGAQFPPLEVVSDGQALWLVDGFHRYHAASRCALPNVLANVTEGTLIDAVLRAAGANTAHGVRRTNGDKMRAVVMVVALPGYADKSDREIARLCGVTHPFVASCRRITTVSETPESEQDEDTSSTEINDAADVSPSRQAEMDAARVAINGTMRLLKEARRQINALAEAPAGAFINRDAIRSDLDNAIAALRGSMPSRLCPVCHAAGCRTCRETGWVSRLVDNHAMPTEFAEGSR